MPSRVASIKLRAFAILASLASRPHRVRVSVPRTRAVAEMVARPAASFLRIFYVWGGHRDFVVAGIAVGACTAASDERAAVAGAHGDRLGHRDSVGPHPAFGHPLPKG